MDKELKAQTDIAKKQYQRLNNAFVSNKDNENVNESLIKKEPVAKSIAKKKYNLRLSLYSYSDDKKIDSLSFKWKYSYLYSYIYLYLYFYDDL